LPYVVMQGMMKEEYTGHASRNLAELEEGIIFLLSKDTDCIPYLLCIQILKFKAAENGRWPSWYLRRKNNNLCCRVF